MRKQTQTILTAVAVVLGVTMLASTFAVDINNAGAVPFWFWLLLTLFAPAILLATIVKEFNRKPSRSETITTVVLAALFLLVVATSPVGSVSKIIFTVLTFMFLILGGFRFARLIMLSARR